jgi:hypothetical protein
MWSEITLATIFSDCDFGSHCPKLFQEWPQFTLLQQCAPRVTSFRTAAAMYSNSKLGLYCCNHGYGNGCSELTWPQTRSISFYAKAKGNRTLKFSISSQKAANNLHFEANRFWILRFIMAVKTPGIGFLGCGPVYTRSSLKIGNMFRENTSYRLQDNTTSNLEDKTGQKISIYMSTTYWPCDSVPRHGKTLYVRQ